MAFRALSGHLPGMGDSDSIFRYREQVESGHDGAIKLPKSCEHLARGFRAATDRKELRATQGKVPPASRLKWIAG